jgi:hypothetical protein
MDIRWTKPLINRGNARSAAARGGGERVAVCRYSVGGRSRRWHGGRGLLFACAIASLTATAALAQAANYKSVQAVPDKPLELSYHASAHKDTCTPAVLPTVRVIEAPQAGFLTVRQAELTTNKFPGCPNLKAPAQVIFYTANVGYGGADHVKYEVTSENGEVATYDVTITVKAGEPGQTPPAGEPGGQHL